MIIGLHGRLQAGKDTTFERIARLSSMPTQRLSFADPLKDSAAALLGVTRDELERMKLDPDPVIAVRVGNDTNDLRHFTGREYLQRYGTEAHRDVFGVDFWRDQALNKATDPEVLYVVTDVRFPNEAEGISRLFGSGYLAHIIGPDGKAAGGHASEQALPDDWFQFEIDNSVRDDGFAHLDAQVAQMLATIGVLA